MSPCIKLSNSINNLFCKLNKNNIFLLSKICNPIISLIKNSELILNYSSYDKHICIKNILKSINFINDNKDKFNIPVLSMHSEFDLITKASATKIFINNCASNDKKLIIFKNSYNHYLLKDTSVLDTIKKNIYDWLEEHI